jgi:hypothetical protein
MARGELFGQPLDWVAFVARVIREYWHGFITFSGRCVLRQRASKPGTLARISRSRSRARM